MVLKYTPAAEINEQSKWYEMSPGGMICEPGTSRLTKTGEWRTTTPVFIADKCKHCLLCVPVCPDGAIRVKDGKRGEFDLEYCKGCGICYKVCPFDAIEFGGDK
ncbi:MAG: 4Fe-4S binding protein [Lachnospiraceae bacterium]|nr:4Fe-4S binding protein [Lachnospiraceae bacterium]